MTDLITIEDFNLFSEDSNSELERYKLSCISSATQIVETYLGYSLDSKTYTETLYGDTLKLYAKPVTQVVSLVVDGITITDFEIDENEIIVSSITKRSVSHCEYVAGYLLPVDVPEVIKHVIKKKANTLFQERGSNQSTSNMSSPEGINRVFTFQPHTKDLQLLNSFRVIRYKKG